MREKLDPGQQIISNDTDKVLEIGIQSDLQWSSQTLGVAEVRMEVWLSMGAGEAVECSIISDLSAVAHTTALDNSHGT